MDAETKPPRLTMFVRITMIVVFVFFTLPILPIVASKVKALTPIIFVDMFLRAVPLCFAVFIDQTLYDGGKLSPGFIPLWTGMTGLLLSPLLLLGIRPSLWESRPWRKAVLGYSSAAFLGTVAASFWVFTHRGIFF